MTAPLRFRVLVGIFATALTVMPVTAAHGEEDSPEGDPEQFETATTEPPGATWHGNAPLPPGSEVADFAPLFFADGYHIFATTGQVYAFGEAEWHGNVPVALAPGEEVLTGTTNFFGTGYTVVTNHGHVFNFGDADCPVFDSANLVPGDEIVEVIPWVNVSGDVESEESGTPNFSCGLYLFSRMGNVYALDAPWCGSVTNIVGDVTSVQLDLNFEDPAGCGYTLATDAGAVYSLGQANWFGALDAAMLGDQRVIQLEPTYGETGVTGHILWTDRGNSYAFGGAAWPGSLPSVAPGEEVILTRSLVEGHLVFTNLGRVEGLGGADTDGSLTPEMLGTQRIVDAEVAFTGGYHMVSNLGNVYAFDDREGGFDQGQSASAQSFRRQRIIG